MEDKVVITGSPYPNDVNPVEEKVNGCVLLQSYFFRSKLANGDNSRIVYGIYDNGVILIHKRIFVKKFDLASTLGFKIITKRFGKVLYQQTVSFKISSLMTIVKSAEGTYKDNIDKLRKFV